MQPVHTTLEIESTYGSIGYSFLRKPLFGEAPTRETMVIIRDIDGVFAQAMILPADVVRGKF